MERMILAILISVLLVSCGDKEKAGPEAQEQQPAVVTIEEDYMSSWDEADNVDSPAFWQDSVHAWIIATAKETDALMIYDAANGNYINRIGEEGVGKGELDRPNGIFVIDDYCFVVERDNHRVQVFTLPEFESVAIFGHEELAKPYGIWVYELDDKYRVYVTDNYETADEQVPPDSLLGKRVHIYEADMNAESIEFGLVKKFGATSGEGTIRVVESIAGDPVHDNLLIAEEDESQTRILVYDIAGNYKKDFGGDLFEHQAEGIALYDCDGDRGYWICTDQTLGDNAFHVFDRKTFEHLGSFLSKTVKNTDGVWLTQEKFDGYPDGCFIAVHNDGGIGAIGWGKIADSLGLRCK